MVHGRAVQEVVDKVDEVMDYAKSKPYFEAWSKEFSDATDGKSLGNVRVMHGKAVAGVIKEIQFNDDDKAIDVGAKIVDDAEWGKVLEGCYTGFSMGGSYVERTAEKMDGRDITRYVAKPSEISIVDNPCIPTAKFFDVVKADGVVEQREFKTAPAEVLIKGEAADVDAFTKVLNDNNLSMKDATALVAEGVARKGKSLADLVSDADLVMLVEKLLARAEEVKKRLDDPELSIVDLMKMADESLTPEDRKTLKTADDVKKAIISKAPTLDAARMQAIHDHSSSMGAMCGKAAHDAGLAKVDTLEKALANALADIEVLKKQPMPHEARLRLAAAKGEESGNAKKADGTTFSIPDGVRFDDKRIVKNADGTIDFDATERNFDKAA
jgi:hypothetical protein